MHLKTRIQIIILTSLLGLIAVSGFGLYTMQKNLYEERRTQISQSLDFVNGLIEHYHMQETSGKMSRADAQARAIEAISAQRQGLRSYYFIRELKGNHFIYHPLAGRLGKPDDGGTLPDGRSVIQAYRDGLANSVDNKTFIKLETLKPGEPETRRFPKLNGVLRFEPWGWMVGIGFYIDDITSRFWQQATYFLVVGAALLALIAILAYRMRTNILRQLGGEPHEAAENMRRIANGDLSVNIDVRHDDNESMMASLKLMQMKLANITTAIQENSAILSKQVRTIDAATRAYAETQSVSTLPPLLKAVSKVYKTTEMLNKSIARFSL